ncbi:MbtH family protein [Plantactinospora endophytica]|uniref:MbtH protein n=1 Tax=Plantactinospora endophytica TaxID=673535 RepID=A0ABQ4E6R5_9ACTN|nr:MbtH family NRPS accessory protein [Plantactinospora endophytica]GIG90400.1 MbtH protein [Plantactinospora endophytica]
MSSPLDDPDLDYLTLVNAEQQHSLWPASVAVPAGWTVVHGPAARDACLGYVRENWTDIRPVSARTIHHDHRVRGS